MEARLMEELGVVKQTSGRKDELALPHSELPTTISSPGLLQRGDEDTGGK